MTALPHQMGLLNGITHLHQLQQRGKKQHTAKQSAYYDSSAATIYDESGTPYKLLSQIGME
jgi:hypothetical protein